MGILNLIYFPEYDTLYFTSGLEKHFVLKLDNRDQIFKVESFCPEFKKNYYEKIINQFEDFLFFRNQARNVQIFDKVGEGGPLLIGDFNLEVGDRIVDM